MVSKIAAFLSLCILSGIFLQSCNFGRTTSGAGVALDTLCIDTICPLFDQHKRPACHLHIKMHVPSADLPLEERTALERFFTSLPQNGAYEEEADGSVEKMERAYMMSYIAQYRNEESDALENYGSDNLEAADRWMSYEELVEGKVLYNSNGFVSYKVLAYSFTGGAHGSTSSDVGVFDLVSLSRVSLSDLFSDHSLPDLDALLRHRLAKNYNCATSEELAAKNIFFSINDISAGENFYIDEHGISWLFDPYEIAPYSEGEVVIALSWDDIYPFLDADAPILMLARKYCAAQ